MDTGTRWNGCHVGNGILVGTQAEGVREIKQENHKRCRDCWRTESSSLSVDAHHFTFFTFCFCNFYWSAVTLQASPVDQLVKRLPAMRETWVRPLGQEDPLEEDVATHSSIPVWEIPWTEELGGLQSTGLPESGTTEPLNCHQLLYNVLFSAVHQRESAICAHTHLPSFLGERISFPSRSPQSTS